MPAKYVLSCQRSPAVLLAVHDVAEEAPIMASMGPCLPPSGVTMDAPTPRQVWGNKAVLRNFSVVRKLDGRPWPAGTASAAQALPESVAARKSGGAGCCVLV